MQRLSHLVLLLTLFSAPLLSHAAFNLTSYPQPSSSSNGYSYSGNPNSYSYQGTLGPDWGFINFTWGTSLEVCNAAVTASGFSEENTTFCVYDRGTNNGTIGSSYYGSGGGNPGGTTISTPIISVTVYQNLSLQERSIAVMNDAIGAYVWEGGPNPGYWSICPNAYNTSPGSCDIFHHEAIDEAPTATLTANPTSIVSGSNAALTHSCGGATTATIDQSVGTVSATQPGTTSVAPTQNTTYTLTCTNASGVSATAQATVTVTPALNGSCSVSPTSATTGQSVTWTASATGGNGTYSYTWSGSESLSGSGATKSKSYTSAGTKNASVTITSGTQTKTVACSNSVNVTTVPPEEEEEEEEGGGTALSCQVSPSSVAVGGSATYTVTGGSAPYTWTAADGGSYGTGSSISRTFNADGNYAMSVSKSGFTSGNCPVVTAGTGGACTNPDLTVEASPNRLRSGSTAVVSYGASGVTSCTISGPGAPTLAPAACVLPSGSFTTPAITRQTVYTLTCDGESEMVIINLIPEFDEF